jgi:hypothetical protein
VKVETAIVIVLIICIFLSFYFSFLSLAKTNYDEKRYLVNVAASSLITGGVMVACWLAYLGVRRFLRKPMMQQEHVEMP